LEKPLGRKSKGFFIVCDKRDSFRLDIKAYKGIEGVLKGNTCLLAILIPLYIRR